MKNMDGANNFGTQKNILLDYHNLTEIRTGYMMGC